MEKPLLAMWGLEPATEVSVNRHTRHTTIPYPKKGCIKPRDKQHCLSRSFNVNFRIMTEAILVCNQYYFNRSLCINYIYSIIWHGTSLKTSFHVSTWNPCRWFLSTDMLSTRLSRIPKRIHLAQSWATLFLPFVQMIILTSWLTIFVMQSKIVSDMMREFGRMGEISVLLNSTLSAVGSK